MKMQRMVETRRLREAFLQTAYPLLLLQVDDLAGQALAIEDTATQEGLAYFHWHPNTGLTRNTGHRRSVGIPMGLSQWLVRVDEVILDAVFVFEGVQVDQAETVHLLTDLVRRLKGSPSKVVFLDGGSNAVLPQELASLAQTVRPFALPDAPVPLRQRLVGRHVVTVAMNQNDRDRLQASLDGASGSAPTGGGVYRSKATGEGAWKAMSGALAPCATAIRETRFLEYFSPEKCRLGLPGFDRWRQEVGLEGTCFVDGLSGCGRSLMPFVAAEALGCGVLRFDGAALVADADYHDVAAIRNALGRLAKSLEPVVIWCDQLQDSRWNDLEPESWLAFAETTRCLVIGTSRQASARTSNKWTRAFAQRWWVDLPSSDLRRDILVYHLERFGLHIDDSALDELVWESIGLSGAELESGLLAIMNACRNEGRPFDPVRLYERWEASPPEPMVASPAPPGWRRAHGEWSDTPLLPFTVLR